MRSKDELRTLLRKTRKNARKSLPIRDDYPPEALARFHVLLKNLPVIAGYRPVGSEMDPSPLLERAAHHGCVTALPFIADRAAAMEFRCWKPGDPLETGVFGFEQPSAHAPPANPDILLVPLLGFDSAMNRLGQGAGHYDRYFSKYTNALRIGIACQFQEIDALPADPWDVPLDAVLTEKGWITGPASRIAFP